MQYVSLTPYTLIFLLSFQLYAIPWFLTMYARKFSYMFGRYYIFFCIMIKADFLD